MGLRNAFEEVSTEATLANRFGGDKEAATAFVTSLGSTTILTPAAGKKLRVYWVSAINSPTEPTTPLIQVGFVGADDYLYAAYAIAHWEIFEGEVDQPLEVNLDGSGAVAVTVHYEEFE